MMTWVLVHSPLVGPASLQPMAAELRVRGQHVILPDLRPALAAEEGDHVCAQVNAAAAAVDDGPVTLVAHSGAGPLVPVIAQRLVQQGVPVAASVFVDARLPHPGKSAADVLPPPAAGQLQSITTDGWLPPWTSWWPPGQLEALVPNAQLRILLINDCPRLPASLFTEVLPHLDDQHMGSRSYLRLSSAYDSCVEDAEKADWPVCRVDSHHLAVLTEPAQVVDLIQAVSAPDQQWKRHASRGDVRPS